MPSRFASKLESLGFKLPDWRKPPSERLVHEYETRFGLALPSDYREFLVHHAGIVGFATCDFLEPTPCGAAACVDGFFGFARDDRDDDVGQVAAMTGGAPDVVPVGNNLMGAMFWLKCNGADGGHVYMDDPEGRFAWPDEMFYERFANLSPTIEDYLSRRKLGELPEKPQGYEHLYRLANNFDQFIRRLERTKE